MGLPGEKENQGMIAIVRGGQNDATDQLAIALLVMVDQIEYKYREKIREILKEAANGEMTGIAITSQECEVLLDTLPEQTAPIRKWVNSLAQVQARVRNNTNASRR